MLLMLLFSFNKYLPGVKGGHISGLIFFLPINTVSISMTQLFGIRLHHLLNIDRDLGHERVLSLREFI